MMMMCGGLWSCRSGFSCSSFGLHQGGGVLGLSLRRRYVSCCPLFTCIAVQAATEEKPVGFWLLASGSLCLLTCLQLRASYLVLTTLYPWNMIPVRPTGPYSLCDFFSPLARPLSGTYFLPRGKKKGPLNSLFKNPKANKNKSTYGTDIRVISSIYPSYPFFPGMPGLPGIPTEKTISPLCTRPAARKSQRISPALVE